MEPEGRVPLRERKKRKTRCELEAAALRLFSERGFDAVTVEEITDAAEVSKRTFFRYYACKEDVLFADHARHLRELELGLDGRPAGEPVLAAVRAGLVALAATLEEEQEQVLTRARIVVTTRSLHGRALEVYSLFQEAIAEAVARRCGADPVGDLRVRLVAGIAATALREAVQAWALGDRRESLPALVDTSLELSSTGLAGLLSDRPRPAPVRSAEADPGALAAEA
jgi:AcrR family transcriptional regulator